MPGGCGWNRKGCFYAGPMKRRVAGRRIARSLACVAVLFGAGCGGGAEEYARYPSPDSAFALVVYRQPALFAMPGQGSDAPGYVVLTDRQGRTLRRAEVAMVQLVEPPRWTASRVEVKLLLDWELPAR